MTQENRTKVIRLFTNYLISNHEDEIAFILEATDTSLSYAVYVNCEELLTEVFEVSFKFFMDSSFYLGLLQTSVLEAQKIVYEKYHPDNPSLKIKRRIVVRLHSIHEADDIQIKVPSVKHVNKLVSFNGTVTKAFTARMLESSQLYNCNKCGMEVEVEIDYGNEDILVKPSRCTKDGCTSTFFNQIVSEKNLKYSLKDYQEIKVQEKLDIFSVGSVPRSVIVILEDDLVDSCKPGDDVTINGIVIERWARLCVEMRADIDLVIHANFITVHNDEQSNINITAEKEKQFQDYWDDNVRHPMSARNTILRSLCPQLYGMYIVKLALMLVLTGGVSRSDSSGTRVRGESHLLLVGDPGNFDLKDNIFVV